MKTKPLVTIITVVFNGERFIEETILSVLNQTYPNIEYIIIDGGSTDGTVKIIQKYADQIDYWISEKDNGIYDAMNKGVSLGNGEILGLINADDYYFENCVELVVNAFNENKADLIFGNKFLYDQKLNLRKKISVDIPKKAENLNIHSVHPTVFVHRTVYETIKFNSTYKISADYDFLLNAYDNGYKYEKIDENLAVMRTGGASANINFEVLRIKFKRFGLLIAVVYFIKFLLKKFFLFFLAVLFQSTKNKKFLYQRIGWH